MKNRFILTGAAFLAVVLLMRADAYAQKKWMYHVSGGGVIDSVEGLAGCQQEGDECIQLQFNGKLGYNGEAQGRIAFRRLDFLPDEQPFLNATVEVIDPRPSGKTLLCGPVIGSEALIGGTPAEDFQFAYASVCVQDNGEGANDLPDLLFLAIVGAANWDFGGCNHWVLQSACAGNGHVLNGQVQVH